MTLPRVQRAGDLVYEIPRSERADMRVPARIFADADLITQISRDRSLEQLANVATLPGIVEAAFGMPDMHEGYGFPVGGVAGTELPDGVISPGGIGFDINCGVRLLVSELTREEVAPKLTELVHDMSRSIPTGFGRGGRWVLSSSEMDHVLEEGVPYLARKHRIGTEADLESIESGGCLEGASAKHVSERAKARGQDQLGSLGSGNHFLEVEVVDEVFDAKAAKAFGLEANRIVVLIHTGSRGLGHQVCSDHVRIMDQAQSRFGLALPDRQLAGAPFSSPEGQAYFAAMCAAANFGWCNRQTIAHRVRDVFARFFPKAELRVLYDVAHNTAKVEEISGRKLCVHRKGATRAFGPSSGEIPAEHRGVGQPVFIPGSMGTASFVLAGTDASRDLALSSCCHGAGRSLSRSAAKRQVAGHLLRKELEERGIVVRCPSNSELAEEAPKAYKDVERVVDVVHRVGLAGKVARLRPLGVVKG
ncbi:MAG: RtcB family protein [Deltaproteobacteria bacterium]|nr:RtcB family protein [Deltaproteobacteria bacterium]